MCCYHCEKGFLSANIACQKTLGITDSELTSGGFLSVQARVVNG